MQASKIELRHKIYAVNIAGGRYKVKGEDEERRVPQPDALVVSAYVNRIVTDRHENGPKGMTQRVHVVVQDLNFRDGEATEVWGLDPDRVRGEAFAYAELMERKRIQEEKRQERERLERFEAARLALMLHAAGHPESKEKTPLRARRRLREDEIHVDAESYSFRNMDTVAWLIALLQQAGEKFFTDDEVRWEIARVADERARRDG